MKIKFISKKYLNLKKDNKIIIINKLKFSMIFVFNVKLRTQLEAMLNVNCFSI